MLGGSAANFLLDPWAAADFMVASNFAIVMVEFILQDRRKRRAAFPTRAKRLLVHCRYGSTQFVPPPPPGSARGDLLVGVGPAPCSGQRPNIVESIWCFRGRDMSLGLTEPRSLPC